jgi:acetyltransferase-like isoleucine patch superfamily enzyme
MTGLVHAATRLVQRIKRDPTYVIHPNISARDVLVEVRRRAAGLLWAQWALRGVGGSRIRFAERGCRILHRSHCTIGKGSVVEAYVRLSCLSEEGFDIGERVTLGKYSILESTGVLWNLGKGLKIGDDSALGDWTFIGASGGVRIGRNVLMGQRVAIHSQNHVMERTDVPIQRQGVTQEGVIVGDGCWLGSGCILLDGTVLGPGCVVAAGAVVTTSFPGNVLVGGVPARIIKER